MPSSTSARRTGRANSNRQLPVNGLAGSILTLASELRNFDHDISYLSSMFASKLFL
jgi:hypothetical protein